jgi:hypothetical protein
MTSSPHPSSRRLGRLLEVSCLGGLCFLPLPVLAGLGLQAYHVARIVLFFGWDRSILARLSGLEGKGLMEAGLVMSLLPWILGLLAGRSIFRGLAQGYPFRDHAVRGFRLLAWAWFMAFPLGILLRPAHHLSIPSLVPTLILRQGHAFLSLLAGLACLALARIMEEGRRLRAEQDLVI